MSERMEERHLGMRGIFEIKYLTSQESVLKTSIVDHDQMITLADRLKTDTTVKNENRRKMAKIHQRLKDERNFLNTSAIHTVPEKVIGPYQMCVKMWE